MIGQSKVIATIRNLIDSGFPRFLVITGRKGQGKKYMAKYIANQLKYPLIMCEDNKVETIRNIIELCYKQTNPTIYLIPDADKMSLGAKNSLLKVIEEPPNNAYFIMTLQSIENTLDTIKSRCFQLKMDSYTDVEISKFIDDINFNLSTADKSILINNCTNRRDVKLFIQYGINEFLDYVIKVKQNIYRVQSANSFKITEKLDIKNEGIGYDIELFLTTLNNLYILDLLATDDIDISKRIATSITKTSQTIQNLSITGISKQSLIDVWILDIRRIWLN